MEKRSGFRQLDLKSGTWQWRIGKGGGIVIFSPEGQRHLTHGSTVKGISPDDFEKGKWKKTLDGAVGPGEIRQYIERNLV